MKGIIADMKFGGETLKLYAVTDRAWTGDMTIFEQVECALKGGVTCVQLREKYLCGEDFLKEAVRMKEICSAYGVPLIINDNISVALRSGADGIHVGQSDMGVRKVRESVLPRIRRRRRSRRNEQARIISERVRFFLPEQSRTRAVFLWTSLSL